jgi:hypothetical protein
LKRRGWFVSSGRERDWKSIQAAFVKRGYRNALNFVDSEKIMVILNVCCQQAHDSNNSERGRKISITI